MLISNEIDFAFVILGSFVMNLDGYDTTCSFTNMVLMSIEQKPNFALVGAIEEWVGRVVEHQIKSAVQYFNEEPLFVDHIYKFNFILGVGGSCSFIFGSRTTFVLSTRNVFQAENGFLQHLSTYRGCGESFVYGAIIQRFVLCVTQSIILTFHVRDIEYSRKIGIHRLRSGAKKRKNMSRVAQHEGIIFKEDQDPSLKEWNKEKKEQVKNCLTCGHISQLVS
ncbi:hypothetical protein CR513_34868, partial [Mucuna pruriens]